MGLLRKCIKFSLDSSFLVCRYSTMSGHSNKILRLVACSVTVANRAGKIIRDIMSRGELGIVEKGKKNDVQTEADRSAQRCIIASLSLQFPSITIIGEEEGITNTEVPSDWIVTDCDEDVLKQTCPEEYKNVSDKDIVIWVDPLDGTMEFTQVKGFCRNVTVLIGIAIQGRAIGGVVHQPYYNYETENGGNIGRTLWGVVNVGIGGFTLIPPPKDKLIICTSRSHSSKVVREAVDVLKPNEVIKEGGAGYKVMMLLEGQAHAYVFASPGCKKWDTCAPEAVLAAAGGQLTNFHNTLYNYSADVSRPNTGGVFATAPNYDHQMLLSQVPQEIKDTLK